MLFVLLHTFRFTKTAIYKKYRNVIVAGSALFAALCVFCLYGTLAETESVVVRDQLNMSAIKMIWDNPIFGVGWGNFLTALPFYLSIRTIYFLQPVHNIYLLAVSQLGIVGTFFICFTIYIIMKRMKTPFSVAGISLFLVFLLGFTDHYFLTLQQGQLLFVTIVGLFLASVQWRKSPPA
jgi:O-antigen ligase